jgi:hypothetical protein
MSLVRLPQTVSISPKHHHHHHYQASPRQAELRAKARSNHPVPVIGCLVWVHVSDADVLRHLKYLTSSRNGYAPLPNSHFLRYHPRSYPHERCSLYRLGDLPHHHDAFLHHQYRMPMLPASGQIGLQCHRSIAYKLQTPSGITNPKRLHVLSSTLRRRTRARATIRRSPRILRPVLAAGSCGLNDDGCFGSLRIVYSHTVHYVDVFCLTSTHSDTSSDAVHRRPHGTNIRRWRTHGFFLVPQTSSIQYSTIRLSTRNDVACV